MVEKLSIEDVAACEDTLAMTYEPIDDDAPDTVPAPPWWDPKCVDSQPWPEPLSASTGEQADDDLPF